MKYECPKCKGRLKGTMYDDFIGIRLGDSTRMRGIVKCSDCGKSFEIAQYYTPVSDYKLKEEKE